ncbi:MULTISPECIES: hypothetical protein [unclassified Nocardioides]|uniref:hypothetical protein n=1 Tax=unclassified Nocardioides TaxID=2615069 RepID=UPI0006F8CC50|nr:MULTISPECIES: hypothetical protein [unclassified Nocardioides]KQY56806.1 hypothetical protein ASD30_10915 [Nocardioides sp. Root140]KQZ66998.1 hypothetical protein ASD66_18525 [Nocardioides sp. Root151]KRF12927.1 hypothetical protein ASH02_15565 [Nocardioides sp. Soil796]
MLHFPATELTIPSRFCGPPKSGNGGWSAGALAALVQHDCPDNRADRWPVIEVTLRQPPPLDAAMTVAGDDDGTLVASFGGLPVLSARVLPDDTLTPVEQVSPDEARAAEASYAGLRQHPFPTCFACGTDRAEGDGLRVFPGPVGEIDGQSRVASTWTPHPSVQEDYHEYVDEHGRASLGATWAALDCIGAWAGDFEDRALVLGRMTAAVDALPAIGEEHVVVGQARGTEGRKTFTASTLYDADRRVVARAEHTWIAIDPADFS